MDKDFEKFLEEDSNSNPDSKLPFFLMVTVREKLNSINEMYKTSLEHYSDIPEKDPIKADMADFISEIMEEAKNGLNQLNILMSSEIDGEEDDSNTNEDENSDDH